MTSTKFAAEIFVHSHVDDQTTPWMFDVLNVTGEKVPVSLLYHLSDPEANREEVGDGLLNGFKPESVYTIIMSASWEGEYWEIEVIDGVEIPIVVDSDGGLP